MSLRSCKNCTARANAVNAAANLEEADDGSSRRDFRAKDRIALRELKESRLRLRILRRTGYLTHNAEERRTSNLEPRTQLGFGPWDLEFGIYLVSPVSRGEPGVTSNAKRSAGILLPG